MQANVNKALDAVKRGQKARADYLAEITKLRAMMPRQREEGRAKLMYCIGRKCGVAVVEGAGKAKGQMVLDSEATSYEAARKALQRMLADIYGKNPGSSNKADPVALLLKSYKALTAAQKRSFKAQL